MITERLKTETRPHHDAIEAVAFSNKIMDGSLSLDEYKILIRNNYLLHYVLENQLDNVSGFAEIEGLEWDQRRKLEFLKKDLEVLGLSAGEIEAEAEVFELTNIAEALGAFYVLEGSTLGGSVIARQLAKNQNLTSVPSYHFYGCYGDLTGPRWKAFQQALIQFDEKNGKGDAMVSSACRTFDYFTSIFRKSLAQA